MKIHRNIYKGVFLIFVLFIIQIITFYFLAKNSIENVLLPSYLTNEIVTSDSVYVLYNENDRWLNEGSNMDYWPIKLDDDKDDLLKKLKGKFIIMEDKTIINKIEVSRKKYQNHTNYFVFVKRPSNIFFNLFGCNINEYLFTLNKMKTRKSSYKWILFFWIETYEYISIE